jgi:hypothetical protein
MVLRCCISLPTLDDYYGIAAAFQHYHWACYNFNCSMTWHYTLYTLLVSIKL